MHLADLADYQEGAVVSREIIRKSTGTVTLFAFDKGQGLSEHIAPFDALVHILDGEAEITISGVLFGAGTDGDPSGQQASCPAGPEPLQDAAGDDKVLDQKIGQEYRP